MKQPALNQISIVSPLLLFAFILGMQLSPVKQAKASERGRGATEATAAGDDEDDATPATSGSIAIAPGFKLHISCPDDVKINGDFRVSMEGQVSLPYDVTVNTTGMHLSGLKKHLERSYQQYFKGRPRISISVKQRRYYVKVLGLVKSPGSYLVKEHTTLDEALAMAQVRTEDLSSGFARVGQGTRWRWISMEDYFKGGKSHDLPAWQGGEQILFQQDRPESEASSSTKDSGQVEEPVGPSDRKVQVLGEVKNPGAVSFQKHADAYYYFIQKGGPTRDSDLTEVEQLRKDPKTNEHRRISLGDIRDIKDVREADILLIHPDRPSGFDRGLQRTSMIATIISAIVITVLVVNNK